MPIRSVAIVLVIVAVCATSARLGQARRREGRRVSLREVALGMAGAWAAAWLAIGLPSLVEWGRHVSRSEVTTALAWLLGLAFGPLAFVAVASWAGRMALQAQTDPSKPAAPHPLD